MPELDLIELLDVERQALVFLLMIPVVATIAGIARHIVGLKGLGIYAPIVLTFAFYALGLNGRYGEYSDILAGLRYGLAFMAVVIGTTTIGVVLTKGSPRMHYFPKIALNISLVAFALLGALILADMLGREGFTSTNALALVMIVTVTEQFTGAMFKRKLKKAFLLTIETVLLSMFCYVLIAWPTFQDFILLYPYAVLLAFVVNYIVGKYRGLRIREYYRFRKILNGLTDDER